MMTSMFRSSLSLALVLLAGCAIVPKGDERVQKPIDETYEPLDGAAWNHRYSKELEELRAWRDAKAAFEREYQPEPGTLQSKPSIPEDRIQGPEPTVTSQRAEPTLEEDEDSLRIRE